MERSMSLNLVDSYWDLLKNLSTDMKLKLISKLSDSLIKENKESEHEDSFDKFYGAWKDDKEAEELIDEIRSSRTFGKRCIETLD
ncbi:MAG: hypothetical protein LUF01_16485 [Bacteroides sp.]|nr:hypothetical protein [Bacteroides sp.]